MHQRRALFAIILVLTAAAGVFGLVTALMYSPGYPPSFIIPTLLLAFVVTSLIAYALARRSRSRSRGTDE